MAVQKQYRNPLAVGDTVRITGMFFTGHVGGLKVIDPENIASCDFFGVYLDSIETIALFQADEIEKVKPLKASGRGKRKIEPVEDIDYSELPF